MSVRHQGGGVAWRFVCLAGVAVLMPAWAQTPSAGYRLHGYARTSLRVIADDFVERSWRVTTAELRENLGSTWGVLDIRNISAAPIEEARFLGEYYDGAGRRCLTLAFASEANGNGNIAAIGPGEDRELLALDAGLAPADEPVEVRVHLVSQRAIGEAAEIAGGESIMRAPVTVGGPSQAQWQSLRLNLDPSAGKPPVIDLVLARVSVGAQREVERVEILNSLNADLGSWFQGFVRQLHFDPATVGNADTPGAVLLLVRAIQAPILEADPAALLTRKSAWVQNWSRHAVGDLPPVVAILFERSAYVAAVGPNAAQRQAERIAAGPNLFELEFAGAGWSENVLVHETVDHQTGRKERRWKSPKEILQ